MRRDNVSRAPAPERFDPITGLPARERSDRPSATRSDFGHDGVDPRRSDVRDDDDDKAPSVGEDPAFDERVRKALAERLGPTWNATDSGVERDGDGKHDERRENAGRGERLVDDDRRSSRKDGGENNGNSHASGGRGAVAVLSAREYGACLRRQMEDDSLRRRRRDEKENVRDDASSKRRDSAVVDDDKRAYARQLQEQMDADRERKRHERFGVTTPATAISRSDHGSDGRRRGVVSKTTNASRSSVLEREEREKREKQRMYAQQLRDQIADDAERKRRSIA